MTDVKKITDRTSIEHKTVCIKVGIIPGTGYALKFCEYLIKTGATDWYEDNNGNIKFKPQVLKTYKNDWITREKLLESASRYGKSPYGLHLRAVAEGKVRG